MAIHTITKATLANTLFDQLGLNKREAKEFVELFRGFGVLLGPSWTIPDGWILNKPNKSVSLSDSLLPF